MCTEKKITTCFARKGPKPKDEDAELRTVRRIIGNLRATVMEAVSETRSYISDSESAIRAILRLFPKTQYE